LAPWLFFEQLPEHIVFHGDVGKHPLELGMLDFEFFDPFEFGDTQSAVFALPVVVSWLANAVLTAKVCHLHAGIGFVENRDNLCLAESIFFQGSSGEPRNPHALFLTCRAIGEADSWITTTLRPVAKSLFRNGEILRFG